MMKELGTGYTAVCKLGFDQENQAHVALKVLKPELGLKAVKAVKNEVESLTKLSHPNIVKIYDV